MVNLSPYMLLLSLAGFLVLGLAGRALPQRVISVIGCGVVLAAFVLAAIQFFSMLPLSAAARTSDLTLWNWVTSGGLSINFGVLLDPLSAVMLLIVTGVGFLIHVYSIGYMEKDDGYWRFFSFMNLFIFAMTLLVVSDSFLFLLVGWGGVGLASFLLIGFWYTRPSAVAAARKAFVVNVIGDFGLLLAIFLIFGAFSTVAYHGVIDRGICPTSAVDCGSLATGVPYVFVPDATLTAIALLLFVAAAAKSAQIPLQVWLPDAMEGPTPVSALIHAATMVTAGVYLVARAWPLFLNAPYALPVVGGIAGATALYAATIACVQMDIKRILAYSTMSQLGYMFLGEAARNFSSGIFHLVTHAFFKALLFMTAGAVIHALAGEQDIRKMGGLRRALPTTFGLFIVGGLALAAIPPFSGFWSKDSILGALMERAIVSGAWGWWVLYGIGLLTAILTGYYIFRLIFVVFLGQYRGGAISGHHGPLSNETGGMHGRDYEVVGETAQQAARDPLSGIHEIGQVMHVPMLILGVLSVVGGFVDTGFFPWLNTFLASSVYNASEPTWLSPLFWVSLVAGGVASLLGLALAWHFFGRTQPDFAARRSPLVVFLDRRYFIDDLYDAIFVRPMVLLGQALRVGVEDEALDGGTRGLGVIFAGMSRVLRTLETGYVRNYALAIFLGAALILLYYVLTFIVHV